MQKPSKPKSTTPSSTPRQYAKAGPIAVGLGIHKKTLFRWADAGRLTRYKLNGNVVLFDVAEVQALIEGTAVKRIL